MKHTDCDINEYRAISDKSPKLLSGASMIISLLISEFLQVFGSHENFQECNSGIVYENILFHRFTVLSDFSDEKCL